MAEAAEREVARATRPNVASADTDDKEEKKKKRERR